MNLFDDDEAAATLFGGADRDSVLEKAHGEPLAPTYRWRELDSTTAQTVWSDLGRWVSWFAATYRLTTSVVPDCWWRHTELVAELYALQKAELASFTRTDPGFGPLGFHERLPLAIERLRQATRTVGCVGLQAHRETKPRDLPAGGTDFDAWATESHQQPTAVIRTIADAGHVVSGTRRHG
ncbi:hypothetical protein [Arthrobacter sp. H14-L1]|uniref:hypothetical protein n=1 Tax=Arthrobacter sp. H14-L1 TaxID=2996697 RepID=UPI0022717768|nr:hypothetical protein [Arthrobacter sp. H14-L1]MCY0906583.1 hypothetical protein [Arthrobacter sp. H14-L1]